MDVLDMALASSSSDIRSSSSPLSTGLCPANELVLVVFRGIPSFLPMAKAVVSASPVIMMTLTPPAIRRRIDLSTSFRGGSFIPTIPAKTNPWYGSSFACRLGTRSTFGRGVLLRVCGCVDLPNLAEFLHGPLANPRTRRPSSAIFSAAAMAACRLGSSRMISLPSFDRYVSHRLRTCSKAPLIYASSGPLLGSLFPELAPMTTPIHFLSELNGVSPERLPIRSLMSSSPNASSKSKIATSVG